MSGGWQPEPTSAVPQPPNAKSSGIKYSWAKTDFIQNYLLIVLSNGKHSHWESEAIINWAKKSWELIHGE
jgi:hypothetical protein